MIAPEKRWIYGPLDGHGGRVGQLELGQGLRPVAATADVAMVVVDVVKRQGNVDILFNDAGFPLIDLAALLCFR